MKHHRVITRKPQLAQTPAEEKYVFIINLVDQIIEFIFNITR